MAVLCVNVTIYITYLITFWCPEIPLFFEHIVCVTADKIKSLLTQSSEKKVRVNVYNRIFVSLCTVLMII